MCASGHQQTLCKTATGSVHWCECCQSYSVIFGTTCMAMRPCDYKLFMELLQSLEPHDFVYHFTAPEQIILKHNRTSVGLCLTPDQAGTLLDLMSQAALIEEAMRLLSPEH